MGTADGKPASEVHPLTRLSEPRTELLLETCAPGSPLRTELEAFIQEVFARSYGARIREFYPWLLALRRPDAELAAVAGLRPAHTGALFCEAYLDVPVERLLARACGQPVPRERIVEVGNLAPASVGQARWLIATVTAYLQAAGFSWVVFTAVPTLHNAFRRMGLRPLPLADADPARLADPAANDWGRYYEGHPLVYAGHIRQGFQALNGSLGPHLPRMERLWHDALCHGRAAGEAFGIRPLAEVI